MQLVEQKPGNALFVRHCMDDRVVVVDRVFTRSFLLTADRVVESWAVDSANQLGAADAEAILALEPELLIFGSGVQQVFPPKAFQAAFLTRRIGIESMNNAAAARTFNLISAEGRRVVASFILPVMP